MHTYTVNRSGGIQRTFLFLKSLVQSHASCVSMAKASLLASTCPAFERIAVSANLKRGRAAPQAVSIRTHTKDTRTRRATC